jgi:RHS repeat-associated protein
MGFSRLGQWLADSARRGAARLAVLGIAAVVLMVFGGSLPAVSRLAGLRDGVAAAATGPITEYPVPTAGSTPYGMAAGPDGSLWFAEWAGDKIGKITPSGTITEYAVPTAGGGPYGITAGPDGNLWFTENPGNKIGTITPSGTITEYPVPTAGSHLAMIAAGPDGNLWFTENGGNKIGKITPAGKVTEYPVPAPFSEPWGITAGRDGSLWFTENDGNKIGRITTSGTITEYPIPVGSRPYGIAAGPDGNLWFAENGGNKIGSITTSGTVTEYSVPTAAGGLTGMTAGPDGDLWFTEYGAGKIGSITPMGQITEYPVPAAGSSPWGLTPGPDGNLWFSEAAGNQIGLLRVPPASSGGPAQPPQSPAVSSGPVGASSVDPASGTYTTSVPIEVPSFHGIEPKLALAYSSNAGDGWAGQGWQLEGLSYITRESASYGSPAYQPSDVFRLDGSQLVPCGFTQGNSSSISPSCRMPAPIASPGLTSSFYTTRAEQFLVIERTVSNSDPLAETWTVIDKSGTRRLYLPDIYETVASSGATVVPRLHLASVTDLRGNVVTYHYTAHTAGAEPTLSAITYNGSTISFYSGPRPDTVSRAIGGAMVQLQSRLNTIDVLAGGARARAYALAYESQADLHRSVLHSVSLYGTAATVDPAGTVGGTPVSTDTFGTRTSPLGSSTSWVPSQVQPYPATPSYPSTISPFTVNELGLPSSLATSDQMRTGRITPGPGPAGAVILTNSNCLVQVAAISQLMYDHESFTTLGLPAGYCTVADWWLADVNGDGLDDLLLLLDSGTGTSMVEVFPNNANFAFFGNPGVPPVSYQLPLPAASYGCAPGDVDGIGHASLICLQRNGTMPAIVTLRWAQAGWSFSSTVPAWNYRGLSSTSFRLADVNGDGRLDLVRLDVSGRNCITGLDTAISDGTAGWRTPVFTALPPTFCAWANHLPPGEDADVLQGLQAGDVNHDGRTDLVSLSAKINSAGGQDGLDTVSLLSNGDGTFAPQVERPVPAALFCGGTCQPGTPPVWSSLLSWTTGNIDGSGTAGLLLSVVAGGAFGIGHVKTIRAPSNGDGTFTLPSSLDDPAWTQDLPIPATEVVIPALGLSIVGANAQPGDQDAVGNGLLDYVAFVADARNPRIVVGVSPQVQTAQSDWQPSTGAGGVAGYVAIQPDPQNPVVRSLFGSYRQDVLNSTLVTPGGGSVDLSLKQGWYSLQTQSMRPSLVFVGPNATYWLPGQPRSSFPVFTYLADQYSNRWAANPVPTWFLDPQFGWSTHWIDTWQPADVNGDGRATALVRLAYDSRSGQLQVFTLLPNADGTWSETSMPLPGALPDDGDGTWRVASLLGDRRADLIHVKVSGTTVTIDSLLSQGGGLWTQESQTFTNVAGLDQNAANWLVGDVNGDGAADLVHVSTDSLPGTLTTQTFLALGNGQWQAPVQPPPLDAGDSSLSSGRWALLDINHDGLADLVHVGPYPEQKSCCATEKVLTFAGHGDGTFEPVIQKPRLGVPDPAGYGWLFDDLNQDGNEGITQVYWNGSGFSVSYSDSGNVNDARITLVNNGIGGSTAVTYSATNGAGCSVPQRFVTMTVASTVTSPGPTSAIYRHECAVWSPEFHRSLGFSTMSRAQAASASTAASIHFVNLTLSENCGAQVSATNDDNAAGHSLSGTSTLYQPPGNGPSYSCLPTTVDRRLYTTATAAAASPSRHGKFGPFIPAKGGEPRDPESITQFTYDPYGNITGQADTESTSAPARTTTTTFDYSLSPYLVNLPASTTISGPSPLQQTSYCYDGTCAGLPADPHGLLTMMKKINLSTGKPAETTAFTYDRYGNLLKSTDALGHSTTLTYDPAFHIYPASSTNALGQITATKWDTTLGEPAAITDPNKLTTTYTYDQYGRPASITKPGTPRVSFSYDNFGNPSTQQVTTTTQDGSANGLWTIERFDGLGRVYLVARKAAAASTAEVAVSTYADASSRVYEQSNWATAPAPLSAAIPAIPFNQIFTYDALGRLIRIQLPDQTVQTTTYGFIPSTKIGESTETVTDPTGRSVTYVTDPWGREVQVIQAASVLNLAYDSLSRLVSSTDPNGLTTIQQWNSLSHLTSETSPDRGTWTYTYDAIGNMRTATDAGKKTTTYHYDATGRLTSETLANGQVLGFRYDQAGHGASIGQLTSETDSTATACTSTVVKTFSYDTTGRPASETDCIGGKTEAIGYGYDIHGRLNSLTYPGPEQVTLGYDAAGRPDRLGSYVTSATYNPGGAITDMKLGDGSDNQFGYDTSGQGWLTRIQDTTGSGTALLNTSLAYAPNGQVTSDMTTAGGPVPTSSTVNYVYDALERLTSVTGTTPASISYDAAGNVTSNSGVGTYAYQPPGCTTAPCNPTQQVSSTTGGSGTTSYSYNPDGNLIQSKSTTGGISTYSWSAANQLAAITQTAAADKLSVTLSYFPDGTLAEQSGTSNGKAFDIRYFNAFLETGPSLVKNYNFDGRPIAQRTDTSLTYLHDNRLGSPQVITTATGQVSARVTYTAQGARSAAIAATVPGFTGAAYIVGTSLVHLGARYYDTSLGRFISPDSAAVAGDSSQAANRYAYASNDPVNRVDPTGHDDKQGTGTGTCSAAEDTCGSSSDSDVGSADPGSGQSPDGNAASEQDTCEEEPAICQDTSVPVPDSNSAGPWEQWDPNTWLQSDMPTLDVSQDQFLHDEQGNLIRDENGDPILSQFTENIDVIAGPESSDTSAATGPKSGGHGLDLFAFGSLTGGEDTPVREEHEVVGLIGFNSQSGYFTGEITAVGVAAGTHDNYGAVFGGTEVTSDKSGSTVTGIAIAEGSAGVEVPYLGGIGVGAGAYTTSSGETGIFIFFQTGAIGQYGSIGFGFGW